jgi:hypothetical protein
MAIDRRNLPNFVRLSTPCRSLASPPNVSGPSMILRCPGDATAGFISGWHRLDGPAAVASDTPQE